MKNYYLLMAFIGIYTLSPLDAGSRNTAVQVEVSPDQEYPDDEYYDDDDEDVVWVGPGWYYGVWFDTEFDYDDWRHGHHHGDHGHGGHGGHGGGHGGGGHGSSHRGGGGHGGGHH